jgi:hypothetical protein
MVDVGYYMIKVRVYEVEAPNFYNDYQINVTVVPKNQTVIVHSN